MYILPTLNFTLAVAGILLLVVTIALYVDYFLYRGKYFAARVQEMMWPALMATTIGSVALSLLYSEYFGFIPCSLCWLQRIAIYPQALLTVVGFRMRDDTYLPLYGIGLSIFGFLVAVYQYVYQLIPPETREGITPCLLDSVGSDCATKVIDEFGFVTFPFLSAVTFAFLIVLYLYLRRSTQMSDQQSTI